jgi:hypothetical protein
MSEEAEGFPRNEWVKATNKSSRDGYTIDETYYMLLPTGAMMRTVTRVIEVIDPVSPAAKQFTPRRARTVSTSEALCFIPGNYTLKVKGNNRDIVVLEPKK